MQQQPSPSRRTMVAPSMQVAGAAAAGYLVVRWLWPRSRTLDADTRREWAELGVPLGHRARIKQAHKNRHPGMWAPGSP